MNTPPKKRVSSDALLDFKIECYKRKRFDLLQLTPKQIQAMEMLNTHLIEACVFGGGAGGGKSWLGCEWILWNCLAFPGTKWFIGRKELKRLKETTVRTFIRVCGKHRLRNGYHYKYSPSISSTIYFRNPNPNEYAKDVWEGGSLVDLKDLKFMPSDPLYEDLGSTEYTGGFIEEAGEVPEGAFDVLNTRTGRMLNDHYHLNGTILLTCNPKKNFLYRDFYRPWKKGELPERYAFIQSLVGDNDKGESSYAKKLDDIKDPLKKRRLRDGDWEYDLDETVLFDYDSLTNMFTNTYVPEGVSYITADIARMGSDRIVVLVWKGFKVVDIYVGQKMPIDETANLIKRLAKKYKVPMSRVIADEDGVGGGVVDILKCKGFVNGGKVLNGENYANLKTQCAYKLAAKINNNEFYVDLGAKAGSSLETEIIEELSVVKRDKIDSDGKLHINKKEEQKMMLASTDKGKRSPDLADAFLPRMVPELKNEETSSREVSFEEESPQTTTTLPITEEITLEDGSKIITRGGMRYIIE